MSSIDLSKGARVDLTKERPGLKNVMVGLGWDVNQSGGSAFDLDAACFLLGADGKCANKNDFIYFRNLKHSSGAVDHQGDNLTGEGEGDDEQILIALDKVPVNVASIPVVVAIYEASSRNQNFGQVDNAFIRLVDNDTNEELMKYDLTENYSTETAMIMGELYRNESEWKFRAVGEGMVGDFATLGTKYGL